MNNFQLSTMKTYIQPLKSTIYFIVVLLAVHLIWKYGFSEGIDLSGNKVLTFYGLNVSACFYAMTNWLLNAVYAILSKMTSLQIELRSSSIFYVEQNSSIDIVWSCTGVKQMMFFFLVMLCYPQNSIHKLWYIPVGLVFIFLLNVLRITLIVYWCGEDMNRFEMLHEGSKYVFYAIIYLMWILWDWNLVNLKK